MFCPGCGAKLPDAARFCERCGQRVELDARGSRAAGLDRRLVAGGVAGVALAVGAGILVASGVFESDDPERVAVRPAATPAPSAIATPSPTATVTARATAAPRPARAKVQGTCGRNGVGGDCRLSVRARPSSSARELARLDEGDSLRVSCQVRGESVYSSALGGSSTVWSRTASRGYVANVYLAGPRLSPRRITLPRC